MRKKFNSRLLVTILALIVVVVISGGITVYQSNNADSTTKQPTTSKEGLYVGLLQYTSHPSLDAIADGIINTLEEQGYIDNENIELDFQNAQGDQSNLNTMANRFVSYGADVMIAIATPSALALANVAGDIPIILGAITDPENVGLVQSNEEPGGNITGVSDMTPIAKQLELIRQIQPEAKTLGLFYSSSEDNAVLQGELAADLAKEMGFETVTRTVSSTNDVSQVAKQLVSEVDVVWTPNDNIIASAFPVVVEIANEARIPIYPAVDMMVTQGGLATLGLNQYQIGVKTGEMLVELIEGTIQTETEPVRFADETDLVVNFEAAELLGISIPDDLIADAIDSKTLEGEE